MPGYRAPAPCNLSSYDKLTFWCCPKGSRLEAPAGRTKPIATTNAINATMRNLIGHPPASCGNPPSAAAAIRWCPVVAAQTAEPGREISMKFCGSFSDLCESTAPIDRLDTHTGADPAWCCGSTTRHGCKRMSDHDLLQRVQSVLARHSHWCKISPHMMEVAMFLPLR